MSAAAATAGNAPRGESAMEVAARSGQKEHDAVGLLHLVTSLVMIVFTITRHCLKIQRLRWYCGGFAAWRREAAGFTGSDPDTHAEDHDSVTSDA